MFSSSSFASPPLLHIETHHADALAGTTRIPSQSSSSRKIPHTILHTGLPVSNPHRFPCKSSSTNPPALPSSPIQGREAPTASTSLDLAQKEDRDDGTSQDAHRFENGNEDGDKISSDSNAGSLRSSGKTQRFPFDRTALWRASAVGPRVLTPFQLERLNLITNLKITREIAQGRLLIRAVRPEQLSDLENLLADSYSEIMWGPLTYRPALVWILATYLRERQAYLPDAVTLVAFYAPYGSVTDADDDAKQQRWNLAGAVEISFNEAGKPKNMQTPLPPIDAPFLSNMAVIKKLRRRGIGKELLRAAEDLAVQMGCAEMYLHCRMIDDAPLNMYKKSGYQIIETDSILSLITFQRRRHLMRKTLSV